MGIEHPELELIRVLEWVHIMGVGMENRNGNRTEGIEYPESTNRTQIDGNRE